MDIVLPPYYKTYDHENLLINQHIREAYDIESRHFRIAQPNALGTPNRKSKYWKPLFNSIDTLYDTKDKILPVGTLLYHGRLDNDKDFYKNPQLNGNNHNVYFGLDFIISSWILVESFKKQYKEWDSLPPKKWRGYIHVYETVRPIPYHYVKSNAQGVPSELAAKCLKGACIHPQAVFHDNEWLLLQELGTEFTFPRGSKNIQSSFVHKKTYVIDIMKLVMHQTSSMYEWLPSNAIISGK